MASSTKTWSWGSWTPSLKTKSDVAFLTRSFLITNSLNIDISSKKRLWSTVELFPVVRVILYNIQKIYKRFYLFYGGFEVLKLEYFKLLCERHIQSLLKHLGWSFLLKAVKSFQRKIHVDIWVLNKPLIVTTDCNMYYRWKVI